MYRIAIAACLSCGCGRSNFDEHATDAASGGGGSSRRIAYANPGTETLVNVPILIELDSSTIDYATITNPSTDLRFHDEVGDVDLPFEVERWDPSGESEVWVQAPSVGPTSSSMLMYFGPDAAGTEGPASVWAGYDLVHHFTPSFTSSTGAFDATATNAALDPGLIADAVTFAGASDEYLAFASGEQLFDGWSQFTIEFWLYLDYASAADIPAEPQVLDKGGSLALGRVFAMGADIRFQIDVMYTSINAYAYAVIPPRTWTHVAYVFDGQSEVVYTDGVPTKTVAVGSGQALLGSTAPLYLGGKLAPAIAGMVDELRIERTGRDAEWMALQHLSMARQLVTFEQP